MVARFAFYGGNQCVLHLLQILHQQIDKEVFYRVSAVKLDVFQAVVNFEQCKIHQAGHVDFAVLLAQKIFQVVVAERRIFYVDFTDNADFDLWNLFNFNRGEILVRSGTEFLSAVCAKALCRG